MTNYAAIKRGAFISGLCGTAIVAPNAVWAGGAILPQGLMRRARALSPRPYSAATLSAMRQLGIVSVTEAGYQYHSNGQITRPLCDNPLAAHRAGNAPACDCINGNGQCDGPGNGNPNGYPVIGQVVVNYTSGGGYTTFNGAVFQGDFSPPGPHFGMPQIGFGPIYQFGHAIQACVESHLAAILGAMGAIAAAIQKYGVARWGVPMVQGLAVAILRWGPVAGWTPAAAADFTSPYLPILRSARLRNFLLQLG